MSYNTEEIRRSYVSRHNHKRKNQVILFIITDGKKCHYVAVKSLSALFIGITSKNDGDLHCLNYFQSYSAKNKLKKHERLCYNHGYCYVEMPNEDNEILKHNNEEKSMKARFMIFADLDCLLEKMFSYQNNPEKSYTDKKKLSIHLLVTHCLQIIHLTQEKANLTVTKVKIV